MTQTTSSPPPTPSAEDTPTSPSARPATLVSGSGGMVSLVERRSGLYYGWVMLPVSMITLVCTSPGQTYLISQFNESLKASLALSETELTSAYMIGSFLAALPMPWLGGLQDRFGIRRLLLVVVILFAMVCVGAAFAFNYWTLLLAFLGLRMLGQGSMTMLGQNTLAMWWHTHLGKVTGISSVAMPIAFATLPPIIILLIQAIGWRATFVSMGLVVLAVMLPIVVLIHRNRPEDVGQPMDGVRPDPMGLDPIDAEAWAEDQVRPEDDDEAGDADAGDGAGAGDNPEAAAASHEGTPAESSDPAAGSTAEPNAAVDAPNELTLPQALRTRAYWIMTLTVSVWGMIGTGIFFNIQPLMIARGLDATVAASTFTVFAVFMAGSQFVSGFLADRVRLNLLLSLSVALLAAGVTQLLTATDVWGAWRYAAIFALGQGMTAIVASTGWARYFGRNNIGKIRGSIWTAVVAASSFGPFVMGLTYDLFGQYEFSLLMFLAILMPLSLVALLATKPKPNAGALASSTR